MAFNVSKLRYELIRTPLEQPLLRLRRAAIFFKQLWAPELRDVWLEDSRIDIFLRQTLKKNTNCIDIGCHYGSMLSRFCSLAPEGHHLAVEAAPFKVTFLRRKFPEVQLLNMALSDHEGSASFYINRKESGCSGLYRHGEGDDFDQIAVRCEQLDQVSPQDRRFDFLKVDVEGAELLVLRGATKLLARDRPAVLFECGPSGPQLFNYTAGDLYDLFIANRYAVFFLQDILRGGEPATRASFVDALIYPFKALNWIAVAKERLPEILAQQTHHR